MIRIALVGWAENDWRTYRQSQWMAQVRNSPEAAGLPRLHFDIEDEQYKSAIAQWDGSSRESALAILAGHEAVEIQRG